jgi:hypothetical protein
MALTWAEARAKVRGDLWKSATALPDDVVNRALHTALLDLESKRRWLWLENLTLSAALVSDASIIEAPPHCKSITSFAIIRNGDHEILGLLPIGIIKQLEAENDSGIPSNYAFQDGSIHLDAEAKVGQQFYMVYKAGTPADLTVAIASDNPVMGLQQQAIITKACSILALGRLRNRELGRDQLALYEDEVERLLSEDDEARADGHGPLIIPDQSLHVAAFGYQ